MDATEMEALVSRHLQAEGRGDVDGAVAVYTDDIEHDVVGFPGGPHHGKDGAREFYDYLTANFRTEREEVLHRYFSEGAMILEQQMTGTVIGYFWDYRGTDAESPSVSSMYSSSEPDSSAARTSGSTPQPSSSN